MKKMIMVGALAVIGMFGMASNANALTLQQAQNELSGMYCSGSTCTSSVTRNEVTNVTTLVSPGKKAPNWNTIGIRKECPGIKAMNGGTFPAMNVNADCVPYSLLEPVDSGPVFRTDTVTNSFCDTTSKTLRYNGPNTDRANAWSIDTSVSSTSGAC